jgi:hypothetical protein
MNNDNDDLTISRRTLIASAAFVPLAALTAAAQSPAPPAAKALDTTQRRILESFVDRLIPKDELGPGAVEGGAAEYIDRCLADYLAVPTARNFFNRVRRLTLEGMFGDPHYGGNTNFAGWDLIKYPGPRPATSPDDQKMGVEIKPYRRSAWGTDHNGH